MQFYAFKTYGGYYSRRKSRCRIRPSTRFTADGNAARFYNVVFCRVFTVLKYGAVFGALMPYTVP